MKEISL